MNKSDRIVLIFVGLGIWALALTQIFESNNVNAAKTGATWSSPNITAVTVSYTHLTLPTTLVV